MNYFKLFSITFFIILFQNTYAQIPNDCSDAIQICGNSNIDLDVNGSGNFDNFTTTCGIVESDSIWFRLTVEQAGTLGFTLTPGSTGIIEDYDFAVFGPTNSCTNLGQSIRCSSTNPQAANQGNNLTGMNGTQTDVSEGPGANGNSFLSWLDVQAGETYYLLINRPVGNSNFSLEWTGTAEFPESPVSQVPDGSADLSFDQCDNLAPYNDGIGSFNLNENTPTIVGAQTNVVVTYHETEENAVLGTNALASPYTSAVSPQTIYARVLNTVSECFITNPFTLNANGIDIIEPSPFATCDNGADGDFTNGIETFDLESKIPEILNGLNPNEFSFSFHNTEADAETNSNPLPNLFENTTAFNQQVFVRIEKIASDCLGIVPLNLEVNPVPDVFDATIIQCDEDGISEGFTTFDLNQAFDDVTGGAANKSIQFYLSLNDLLNDEDEINANAFENYFNPQIIFALVTDTATGCSNVAEVTLQTSSTSSSDTFLEACDDDGTEDGFFNFNLTNSEDAILFALPADLELAYYETYEDALLEDNPLGTNFTNTIPYSQTIYARVENANACFGISEIELTVFKLPNIVTEEDLFYCINDFPQTITLTGGLVDDIPNNYYYDWSTGEDEFEIEVNEPGIYTVRVTNTDGCFKDRTINVQPSNIATITDIQVTDASDNNTISVFVFGEGTYEYAIDNPNGPYQESNVFTNVYYGFHTVYVRDIKNNCGTIEEIVSVIGFPNFFTPNGDDFHPYWKVKGVSSDFQPNTQIFIFDRYGKLLAEVDPLGAGWDGTFNGVNMPTSDYWYVVTLQDGRTLKGHFSLKR